jgi:hypothetical protein
VCKNQAEPVGFSPLVHFQPERERFSVSPFHPARLKRMIHCRAPVAPKNRLTVTQEIRVPDCGEKDKDDTANFPERMFGRVLPEIYMYGVHRQVGCLGRSLTACGPFREEMARVLPRIKQADV